MPSAPVRSWVASTGVSVSTQSGPALRLNTSFCQIRVRMSSAMVTGSCAARNASARAAMRGVTVPSGSPNTVPRPAPVSSRTTPGAGVEHAGQKMPPMARSGPTARQSASSGSSARQAAAIQRAAVAMEIPPGDAVHHESQPTCRSRSSGAIAGGDRGQGRRLHGDRTASCGPSSRGSSLAGRWRCDGAVRGLDGQAVGPDRGEMRATRHHRRPRRRPAPGSRRGSRPPNRRRRCRCAFVRPLKCRSRRRTLPLALREAVGGGVRATAVPGCTNPSPAPSVKREGLVWSPYIRVVGYVSSPNALRFSSFSRCSPSGVFGSICMTFCQAA